MAKDKHVASDYFNMALSDHFTPTQIENYQLIWKVQRKWLLPVFPILFLAGVFVGYVFPNEVGAAIAPAMRMCGRQRVFDSDEIRANADRDKSDTWSICIYNGASPHLFGIPWIAGGIHFKRAAESIEFTHCVNANTPEAAAHALNRYRLMAQKAGKKVAMVAVIDHSRAASPSVGKPLDSAFYSEVRRLRGECRTNQLLFLGCSVAQGATGDAFIHLVANYCGVTVSAATREVDAGASIPGQSYVQALIRSGNFTSANPQTERFSPDL